jgi:hypothetical protein
MWPSKEKIQKKKPPINLNTFYFFNFELYVFIRSNDLVLKLNPKIFIFNHLY